MVTEQHLRLLLCCVPSMNYLPFSYWAAYSIAYVTVQHEI